MKVLYLGLSNKIRNVAEILARDGHVIAFIKPGEINTRVSIAKNILAEQEIDAIVAAELQAEGVHQLQSVISDLRKHGSTQPVLGLTNAYTEKHMISFFAAGGDVLLPLRQRPDTFFSVSGQLLCGQVKRLAIIAGKTHDSNLNIPASINYASEPEAPPFYGFMIMSNGDIVLHGCKMGLSPRERKLLKTFLAAREKAISFEHVHENMYGSDITLNHNTLRSAVSALQTKIRTSLSNHSYEFSLPFIETVVNKGWRFNTQNLRQLNAMMTGQKAENSAIETVSQHYQTNLISLGSSDFLASPEKQTLYFRGVPLTLPDRFTPVLCALLLADGRVLSRNDIYSACYPSGTTTAIELVARYVNYAFKALSAELAHYGYHIDFPLVRTVGRSGWATIPENLRRLQSMQQKVMPFDRATTLDRRGFSQQVESLVS